MEYTTSLPPQDFSATQQEHLRKKERKKNPTDTQKKNQGMFITKLRWKVNEDDTGKGLVKKSACCRCDGT